MLACWPAARITTCRQFESVANSVQTFELALFPLKLLEMTLDGSSGLALAYGSRLLVMFATTHFRQNTCFFAGALEATQCYVKRLILFHFNSWHSTITYLIDSVSILEEGRQVCVVFQW
ncbi:hypothetical protein BG841_08570 [Marinobacter sp. X15-166B]|nr:hypothetical protein BG841_08570 [Marinobacter sp. X15-166B]